MPKFSALIEDCTLFTSWTHCLLGWGKLNPMKWVKQRWLVTLGVLSSMFGGLSPRATVELVGPGLEDSAHH